MIADIIGNERLNQVVTELFNRGEKINISTVFLMQIFSHLYKQCIAKPYSFLMIDAVLASENLLRYRKNLLERI